MFLLLYGKCSQQKYSYNLTRAIYKGSELLWYVMIETYCLSLYTSCCVNISKGGFRGGGGVMGVATPPNDFKKPRPPWSEV